ncbi:serine hydrolase [Limosilactobacillus caecicola]|uniref:serine hydrolase n=1 Tax=Limosilactobacillus caecicola TaxID=2941332 RepID=UPI00203F8ECA|nr:serine hydrolase [Limosilactobacillus caecicola]
MKKRFKLYKSGKLWCCAALAFAAVTMGTTTLAHAATTPTTTPVKTVQTTNTTSDQQAAPTPATPVTNQVPVDHTTTNNDVNANQGALDHVQVTTDTKGTTTLNASGWQAVGKSNDQQYRYAILYDNTTNREIGRQRVTPVDRPDVQKAYPYVDNSLHAGFNVNFTLPSNFNGHSLSVIARYSTDAVNGEGTHTDYWFAPIVIDSQNRASLDSITNDGKDNVVVSGWHANNAAAGLKYHYIIAYDQTTNREIARQLVKDGETRTDVAKAFPTIANAGKSGFKVSFKLTSQYARDNIQFVSRWTNDPAGNGNAVDYWFSAVTKQNRGNLDQWNLSDGTLQVSGWHANDVAIFAPYHYLIVFDNTVQRQVAAELVPTTASKDVAKVYPDTRSAGNSRFSADFTKLSLTPGHSYSLVSRYSTSAKGNGNDGVYTDYWFGAQTLNQHAFSIDNFTPDGQKLTVSGWMASDDALNLTKPFVILLADGKEIGRQAVTLTARPDVAKAYQGLYKSGLSGFTATFTLPTNIKNNINLVLRFSNAENGEGRHADMWTQAYAANAGNFDRADVNGNTLHVSGWHASMASANRPYEYIIALDGASGKEIQRWNISDQHVSRNDVQRAYPWINGSGQSGFDVTLNNFGGNHEYFKLIHRITDDAAGNGNYVDYEQTIDHTNYQQRLIDAWRNIINQHGNAIGIAIKSQLTGQVVSYTNAPGHHWWMASTVKVPVLSELLHRTGGNLDGTMQSLATRMIRYSDNDATTAIVNNYLGGVNGLYGLFHAEGMNNTYTTPNGWGTTSTTPEEVVKLLNDLYLDQNSGYLNQASRDYVHYQMMNVSAGQDWGISAGTARGSFYIKNGWIPVGYGIVNSIGFIPSADNHHGYAIAVYSDGNPSFQSGINVIEQLARVTKQILQG